MKTRTERLADLIIGFLDDEMDCDFSRGQAETMVNDAADAALAYLDRAIPEDVRHLAARPELTEAERNDGATI